VLFVPSVERDGSTAIDQNQWVNAALERLGRTFGGATAYPKAKGIWRDDERGGALVKDEPVVVHCYTTPADIEDAENLAALGSFCRNMGRERRVLRDSRFRGEKASPSNRCSSPPCCLRRRPSASVRKRLVRLYGGGDGRVGDREPTVRVQAPERLARSSPSAGSTPLREVALAIRA